MKRILSVCLLNEKRWRISEWCCQGSICIIFTPLWFITAQGSLTCTAGAHGSNILFTLTQRTGLSIQSPIHSNKVLSQGGLNHDNGPVLLCKTCKCTAERKCEHHRASLPEDHTPRPGRRWGSPVGGSSARTPSHPPCHQHKKTCPILTVQAFLSTNHLKAQGQQEIWKQVKGTRANCQVAGNIQRHLLFTKIWPGRTKNWGKCIPRILKPLCSKAKSLLMELLL